MIVNDSCLNWADHLETQPSLAFFDPPFGQGQSYAEHDDSEVPRDLIGRVGSMVTEQAFEGTTFILFGPGKFLRLYFDSLPVDSFPRVLVWKYNFAINRGQTIPTGFSPPPS